MPGCAGRSKRYCFFFSSRRRHTRLQGDWSSDVCSSDLTGKSYYGSEVQSPNFRTIDLSQKKPININCGEIIQFSSNGKTFIWKADSIYHSEVPIAKFAPKGFDAQGRSMFVAPNEYEYGG